MKYLVFAFLLTVILITTAAFCRPVPIPQSAGTDTGGDNPLTTSFTRQGNYFAVVEALAIDGLNDPSGIILVNSIPDGSTIVHAIFATTGWHSTVHSAYGFLNGNQLTSIMPTVYDNGSSYDLSYYRWDVTNVVTGNDSYSFSLFDIQQGYIAFIVVIYENPSLPLVDIVLNDGSESLQNASSATQFSGMQQGNGTLMILSQAGDIDINTGEMIEFNGQVLAGPGSVFASNLGDHADYHEFNVPIVENINTLTTTTGGDWLGFHLAILIGATELPPPFEISLTPVNPPIIIPANGGTFSFDMHIANNELYPVTYDIWTMATLPNSSQAGPLIYLPNQTVAPNQSVELTRTQAVPARAASGDYSYHGYVGVYPDSILNEDHFDFEKSPTLDGAIIVNGWDNWDTATAASTGISSSNVPNNYYLSVYPNPFNQRVALDYMLPAAADVRLVVYDITGREVVRLIEGRFSPGRHHVPWDAKGQASGVYFIRLETGDFMQTRKILLVK